MIRKIILFSIIGIFVIINLSAAQQFGVGIIIGSPTGFTAKFIMTQKSAIAANMGWSLGDNPKLHFTCDYQFLFPTVLRWTDDMSGEQREIKNLTPYIGIGGRFRFKENESTDNTELNIGLRLGGGVEYKISRFGIFLEIYPVVNVLPSTDFDIEGGLGARIYF
jgi:hypothetical protein|uniref:DUF3996 domain-containing protein n=1 Tax=candidate division WOR-3 bacterium TaxID=2052148 RepID=A0A7C6AGV4_UNCW3